MLHDLAIVGAGPVGATLALALRRRRSRRRRAGCARQGRNAARRPLARAVARRAPHFRAPRRLGRSRQSRGAVTPITAIDISQAGGFGITRLTADETTCRRWATCQLSRAAGGARRGARARRCAASVTASRSTAVGGRPPTRRSMRAAAMGSRFSRASPRSPTAPARPSPASPRQRHDYGQVALIAQSLAHRSPQDGIAYERFTAATGRSRCCRRATTTGSSGRRRRSAREKLLALDDAAFLARARAPFRRRASAASPASGDRRTFPLALEFATADGRHARASRSAMPRRRCIRSRGRDSTSACATPRARAGCPRLAARRRSATRAMLDRYARATPDRSLGGHRVHARSRQHVRQRSARCCAGRAGWRSLCSTRCRPRSARSRGRCCSACASA